MIAVVTPNPVAATLVVARELGLDEVYAIGGAQAVAALAYGTASIAAGRSDRRAGKCLRHGSEAPRLELASASTSRPGPSEVIVIADGSADPEACAADLLAQAEHGRESEALLLSTDAALSEAVSYACCSI